MLKKNSTHFVTQGNSMAPMFLSGDTIICAPAKKIRVGDVVLIRQKKDYIAHRIIFIHKNGDFITKGDNNIDADPLCKAKNIVGKVVKIKRMGLVFSPEELYALQSTYYFKEITKLTNLFHKNNIRFVILKGLPLHLYYEKTHPKRIYNDCDVLIHANDFSKAHQLLKKMGYMPEKTISKNQIEVNYYKIINGFPVVFDIHLEAAFLMTHASKLNALFPQPIVDELTQDLMINTQEVIIEKYTFPILSPSFLILYLALHFFHHNYRGIYRLEFLYKVIRKHMNKLSEVTELADTYRVTDFVYPVFYFLNIYYAKEKEGKTVNILLKKLKTNMKNFSAAQQVIKTTRVFDDQIGIQAGLKRFQLIFNLSPIAPWHKYLTVLNPQLLLMGIHAIYIRLRRY